MGKTVQHFCTAAELLHRQPVVFLIQEKACFLAVFHINQIPDAVFPDRDIGVKFIADKAPEALHPLIQPHFCVTSLKNTADPDPVLSQNFF